MLMSVIQQIQPATDASPIPVDHEDLLHQPIVAALATLLPDGQPQSEPVWFSYNPPFVLINTMRSFRKERNMRSDPRVSLLIIDPTNSSRFLEVRGRVALSDDGAREHLDQLARQYAGVDRYFGGCVSADLEQREIPVLGRITPIRCVDERSASVVPPEIAPPHLTIRPGKPRVDLPTSHLDLLRRPLIGVLTTLMPGGHPQSQPVWYEYDGRDVSINTTRERQKGKNLERDPRATLLIGDPADSSRWIEIRAEVEIISEGAQEDLDRMTRAHTSKPAYYGYIQPAERRGKETRIICRLIPMHVVCDAIHRPAAQ